MKAKVIFSSKDAKLSMGDCAGGTCPTIYETENGTFLVQGKTISNSKEFDLEIPSDESLVELPKEFIERFKKS